MNDDWRLHSRSIEQVNMEISQHVYYWDPRGEAKTDFSKERL
jgi:hypothetical protein